MSADLKTFLSADYRNLPMSMRDTVFSSIRSSDQYQQYYEAFMEEEAKDSSPVQFEGRLGQITREYNTHKDNKTWSCRVMEGTFFGHDMLLEGAQMTIDAVPGGGTVGLPVKLSLKAYQNFTSTLGDHLVEECHASAEDSALNIMSEGLKRFVEQESLTIDQMKNSPDWDEGKIKSKIIGRIFEDPDLLKDVPKGAQATVLYHMNRRLEKKTEFLDALHQRETSQIASDIESLTEKAGNTQKMLDAFQSDHLESVKTYNTKMEEFNKEMRAFRDELQNGLQQAGENGKKIEAIGNDVSFLKELAYQKMDPKEKKAALERGMINLSPEQKERELKKISLLEKRQEIQEFSKSFQQGSTLLLNGLNNFGEKAGINPKTIEQINTAVTVGQTAVSLFTDISTGNWMGVASTVISLGGRKKKDPGAERHKQVMNALNNLSKGQTEIKGMIKDVITNQQEILKNQQQLKTALVELMKGQQDILEELGKISGKIDETHAEVMKKLDEIHHDIKFLTLMSRQHLEFGVRQAQNFLRSREYFEFEHSRFRDFQFLKRHFDSEPGVFNEGFAHLRDVFWKGTNESLHALILVEGAKGEEGHDVESVNTKLKESVFIPMLSLFALYFPLAEERDQVISAFIFPCKTLSALEKKRTNRSKFLIDTDSLRRTEEHFSHQEEFIHPQLLVRYGRYLVEIQKYLPFRAGEGNLYSSLTKLMIGLKDSPGTKMARDLIESAKHMSYLALAQQNLISGDLLIPKVTDTVIGTIEKNEEAIKRFNLLAKLLRDETTGKLKNSLFAENIMRNFVWKQLAGAMYQYSVAFFVKKDSFFLNQMFPKADFVWRSIHDQEETWYLKVTSSQGDVYLKMPEPMNIVHENIEHSNGARLLVSFLEECADALLEYTLEEDIRDVEHAKFIRNIYVEGADTISE